MHSVVAASNLDTLAFDVVMPVSREHEFMLGSTTADYIEPQVTATSCLLTAIARAKTRYESTFKIFRKDVSLLLYRACVKNGGASLGWR